MAGSAYSRETLDTGVVFVLVGKEWLAWDFIIVLRVAQHLKLMIVCVWNFPFIIFRHWFTLFI